MNKKGKFNLPSPAGEAPGVRPPVILQHDQSDCGVACLLMLIKYYGGHNSLENLRRLSGTNTTGTTLLGLYQAAGQCGFAAQGCEADIPALIKHGKPCILHVTLENNLQHYVVCYGITPLSQWRGAEGEVLIADPAKGLVQMKIDELEKIWQSKTCLTLEPNENFVKAADTRKAKKQWILNLVKEDFPLLGIAAGLGVAIAVLSLVMAIFSQKLIDDILPHKNFGKLYLGIALVFILLLVKEGLSVLRQFFLIRQARSFNIRIIGFFFNHLLALPKPFFDTRKTGEFIARLNDTGRIQRVISQLAGSMAIDILMVLVSVVFIFMYSVTAGFVCVVAMPLFFWMVYAYNKKIIEGQRSIMVNYAQTESNYISTLQGIEPIKNNNRQNLFEKVNNTIYQKFQEAVYKLGTIQIKLSFIINVFGVVFLVGILSYCSYRVLHNQLKTGELIATAHKFCILYSFKTRTFAAHLKTTAGVSPFVQVAFRKTLAQSNFFGQPHFFVWHYP